MGLLDYDPSKGLPPSFMQHFVKKYREEKGDKDGGSSEWEIHINTIKAFAEFVEDHLNENRPSQIGHAESNFIVKLMNNDQFSVAPPLAVIPGSMQEANAMPITGSKVLEEEITKPPQSP